MVVLSYNGPTIKACLQECVNNIEIDVDELREMLEDDEVSGDDKEELEYWLENIK